MHAAEIKELGDRLKGEVAKAAVGQDEAVELFLVSLLCEGHLLLEGPPGTAKTMLTQAFAAAVSLKFGRIQFTPDLMPGDVLGTNLFDFNANRYSLTKGPIFTQLLLADEINRTPPKTQAALLQAMQERNVTLDGVTHDLGEGFMVIATQNPIEQQGTYPLPEAQLDRFLFKHVLTYPSRDEEFLIVRKYGTSTAMPAVKRTGIEVVADLDMIIRVRELVAGILLSDENIAYIVDLVRQTREHASLQVGASPRCANMLAAAARAYAALQGRDYVVPDDIKRLAHPALRHRLVISPAAEIQEVKADAVIDEILQAVPAPR